MGSKFPDDVQHLIDESVYRSTTTVDTSVPIQNEILSKRAFEARGIATAFLSIMLLSLVLLSFLLFQTFFITSIRLVGQSLYSESKQSTWETFYVLQKNITLMKIDSLNFDVNSDCPLDDFALIVTYNGPVSDVEPWLKTCGKKIIYFRMNGDNLENEDVIRTIVHVPNAQYIPIKAVYHKVRGSNDILSDQLFKETLDTELNVVTQLEFSGDVSYTDLLNLMGLIPYVEELTLQGSNLCTSLVRRPKLDKISCTIYWSNLKKLSINFDHDCEKTFEFIDMCWEMTKLEELEITGTYINNLNVAYIENVIDKYRLIPGVSFGSNICSEDVAKTRSYMCK